jgi:hypothetical protein
MPPVHIDPMPTDVGVPLALSQPVNPQPSADALFQRYGMLPRQLQPAGNQGLAQLLQSLLGGQPT